jgi:hypothetical protein
MKMRLMMAAAVVAGVMGCHAKTYGDRRPDVAQLDPRDKGLQSKDVVQASDQMAMDLLADRRLNASRDRWTMVVDRVENHTVNSRFDLDVFLQRLRAKLAQQGGDRIQLIENKAKHHELQGRELENEREDTFGQGSGKTSPGPKGIQPDYALWARIDELPNRGTSYYQVSFTLSNMQTREITWTNMYEVRVER